MFVLKTMHVLPNLRRHQLLCLKLRYGKINVGYDDKVANENHKKEYMEIV